MKVDANIAVLQWLLWCHYYYFYIHSYIGHKLSIKDICTQSLVVEQWLELHQCPVEKVESHGIGVVLLHHLPKRVQLGWQWMYVFCILLWELLQHVCRLWVILMRLWLEESEVVSVTSGSKLDVELCAALRLCLYAVNTSEARTCKSYFLKGVSKKRKL